ncbi:N-acetylmuramoyl-L-alanine amidase [bacterium]|nr:N-acetylmuramoyl-L-alanine amidase [bacterium]
MNNLKILFLSIIVLLSVGKAFSFEIVYPKSKEVTINSDKTFFIGNEKPQAELKINGENVNIHPSGGFYHVVKLSGGENSFEISNGEYAEIYKIIKPLKSASAPKIIQKIYDNAEYFETALDNVPLRATPVDFGINRLQHLEKGIILCIVGEYGNFYKVQLAQDYYAWIDKSHVKKTEFCENSPAQILSYTYEEDKVKRSFKIKLSKKVPYILSEARSYDLTGGDYQAYVDGLDLSIFGIENCPDFIYSLHINQIDRFIGYKIFYTGGNELVIEVKNPPKATRFQPLKNYKITLDPGHGGSETGAIGCLGDNEKDINLAIALKLKPLLEKAGAKVFMTRIDDTEVSLSDRVKLSQANDSDIFISIHNNALPDSLADSNRSGTSIYYFYPQSNNIAQQLLKNMTAELSMNNDKVRQESFAVIRNTESLSVLIEVGYMIVPEDNAKLINPEFQQKVAQSILNGLVKYVQK